MSAETAGWINIGTWVSVIAGFFMLYLVIKKEIKSDICKDMKAVSAEIAELKEETKELNAEAKLDRQKFNEHLLDSRQGMVELEHLKETLKRHDSDLEDLHRELS